MPSLLLVVFVIQLALHIINTAGADTVNQLLWNLYNKFPTPTASAAHEQTRLKREILRLKRELNGVSAQDDFARWAKLRRQYDKVTADYEKTDKSLRSTLTKFNSSLTTLRWLLTNGLRLFLQFYYAKQPMFWIPKGWVPGYVEWLLAFPKAPTGSVSIQIWGIACSSVIALVGEAIVASMVLVGSAGQKEKREPIKMEAERKKEL